MTGKESPTHKHPAELQGWAVDSSSAEGLHQAIDLALDYRGDVTIDRKSTGQAVEGYIFDCRKPAAGKTGETVVRLIPKNSDERVAIPLSDIASLRFSGKDTASGKSFETWIRKYAEKKLAGEKASIESEPLDQE